MKKFMLFLLLLLLQSNPVWAEDFVDSRFYKPIIPFSQNVYPMLLKSSKISYYGEDHILYRNCNLLENKFGYIKFECGKMYEQEDEDDGYKMYWELRIIHPEAEHEEFRINSIEYSIYDGKKVDQSEKLYFVKRK